MRWPGRGSSPAGATAQTTRWPRRCRPWNGRRPPRQPAAGGDRPPARRRLRRERPHTGGRRRQGPGLLDRDRRSRADASPAGRRRRRRHDDPHRRAAPPSAGSTATVRRSPSCGAAPSGPRTPSVRSSTPCSPTPPWRRGAGATHSRSRRASPPLSRPAPPATWRSRCSCSADGPRPPTWDRSSRSRTTSPEKWSGRGRSSAGRRPTCASVTPGAAEHELGATADGGPLLWDPAERTALRGRLIAAQGHPVTARQLLVTAIDELPQGAVLPRAVLGERAGRDHVPAG